MIGSNKFAGNKSIAQLFILAQVDDHFTFRLKKKDDQFVQTI
jgi:hypothetical protein